MKDLLFIEANRITGNFPPNIITSHASHIPDDSSYSNNERTISNTHQI